MKHLNRGEILANLLWALLTTIASAAAPILFFIFSLNGAIDYSVSQDQQSFFVTFNVSNDRAESVDIEIGLSAPVEAIVGSSGTAGIEVLNPAGRAGSILSITKIPPKTGYNAIVRSPIGISSPIPILLRAPVGVELHRVDPTRGRIDLGQLLVQAALIFAIMFLVLSYFDKQQSIRDENISSLRRENENALANLRRENENALAKSEIALAKSENTHIISKRIKVYALSMIRHLNTENQFWRLIFERILVYDGVSKGTARRLLTVIERRLGIKSMANIEDTDLDLVIETLIDEDKRKRFEEMMK